MKKLDLLTTSQAADLLGLTETAIHTAVNRGRLPVHREKSARGGHDRYLIERADLEQYQASRNNRSRPPPQLDAEAIRAIRRTYEEGGITQRELAAQHGVTQATISNVVNRRHAYADL